MVTKVTIHCTTFLNAFGDDIWISGSAGAIPISSEIRNHHRNSMATITLLRSDVYMSGKEVGNLSDRSRHPSALESNVKSISSVIAVGLCKDTMSIVSRITLRLSYFSSHVAAGEGKYSKIGPAYLLQIGRHFLKALEMTTAMKRRKVSCIIFCGCWLTIVVVWRSV